MSISALNYLPPVKESPTPAWMLRGKKAPATYVDLDAEELRLPKQKPKQAPAEPQPEVVEDPSRGDQAMIYDALQLLAARAEHFAGRVTDKALAAETGIPIGRTINALRALARQIRSPRVRSPVRGIWTLQPVS